MASPPTNGQSIPWRQWPKDKRFFRLFQEQMGIPRPRCGAEYDDRHLTDLEFRLVVAIAWLDYRGEGITIDRGELARLIGLTGSDNDKDRMSKLLHGRQLPVFETVAIEAVIPGTGETVAIKHRKKVGTIERPGLCDPSRDWLVSTGGGKREKGKRCPPLKVGATPRFLEWGMKDLPPFRGHPATPAPPNRYAECIQGRAPLNAGTDVHPSTQGRAPLSAALSGSPSQGRAPLSGEAPIKGAHSENKGAHSENKGARPCSTVLDADADDRSIDRSSAAPTKEETRSGEVQALAVEIFDRVYAGATPEMRRGEWTDSWQWYESLARRVIDGEMPRDLLGECIEHARRDRRNRGRKFNGLIGRYLRGDGGPPSVPVPPAAVSPQRAGPPPEPPMDPEEECRLMREWAALPPRDPRHRIGKTWLQKHPEVMPREQEEPV